MSPSQAWRVPVLDDATAGAGLFPGYTCLFTIPDYWEYGRFVPQDRCELPGKRFVAKAVGQAEAQHVFMTPVFWAKPIRYTMTQPPIYVAWKVRPPTQAVAGGRFSYVTADNGPWQIWSERDRHDKVVWTVATKRNGQWQDHQLPDSADNEWIDVQLTLQPDRLTVQVNQTDRGTFEHDAYPNDFELRFGSAQTHDGGGEVRTEFRSVYVNDIPYPYTAHNLPDGPEDIQPSDDAYWYLIGQASPQHPRHSEGDMIELKDGRLLLVWTDYYDGQGWDGSPACLSAKTSSDGGRTWSPMRTAVRDEHGTNVMSVSLVRAGNGDLLLAYFDQLPTMKTKGMVLRRSADEGETWGEPIPITPETGNTHSANNACLRRLASGRIILATREVVDGIRWPYGLYSDDDGRTWGAGQRVPDPELTPEQKKGQNVNEPCIAELADGRLLMTMRSVAGGQFFSWSSDGGESWTKPRLSPLRGACSPAAIKRIPGTDDILAVFTYGLEARTPLVSAVSSDGGTTWKHLKLLEQSRYHGYCYTSITFYRDRVILTTMHSPNFTSLMRFDVQPGYIDLRLINLPVKWFYRNAPNDA